MPKSRRSKLSKPRSKPRSNFSISKLTVHKLNWLEWVTIGFAIWFFIYPDPYNVLLAILLAIPIIGIMINGFERPSIASLVEISKDKHGNDKYDVADFIDVAAWVILIRVLLDFECESFYSLIIPGIIACILILIILFLTHKLIDQSNKSKTWIYTSIIFNVCLYCFAGTYAANCAYDDSEPKIFSAEVLNKRVQHSRRHTSYKVEVAPWGHHFDKEEIAVSKEQYDEVVVGDFVNIDLKKGLFAIPWFYIERKKYPH